jgi:hypothetical protein
MPCSDAANNSNACSGDESKINSFLLSPLVLLLVMFAFSWHHVISNFLPMIFPINSLRI